MRTKLITALIAGVISFSSLASEQPPANFKPNKSDPAYIAQDKSQPNSQRVAALEALRAEPSQNGLIAIARALKEEDPSIQEAAIIGSYGLAIEYRWELVSPFLKHEDTTLSYAASYGLVKGYPQLTASMKPELDKYIPQLEAHLSAQQDSFSHFKLAEVYRLTGQAGKAITEYSALLEKTPHNQAVWAGLSESYRLNKDESKALQTLERGIELNQNSSQLYYAKSLAEVRQGNKLTALADIKSAAILAENNSYYWYLYAVMQKEQNLEQSVPLFEHAYQLSGAPEELYALCDVYIETHNNAASSCLEQLKPQVPKQVYAGLVTKSQTYK